MGDPETEVVMPRLENDLVALILKMEAAELDQVQIQHSAQAAATVMLVSGGYPGDYAKGKVINGLDRIRDSILFHAGTTRHDAEVRTAGGRVIAVTSLGSDLKEALAQSYRNADLVDFENKYYRKDIGYEFI